MERRTGVVLAALVAAALVVVAGWSVARVRAENDRFDAVWSRFRAPAEWKLVAEFREPAQLLCTGGDGCPSGHARWVLPTPVTSTQLTALFDDAGWPLDVAPGCPDLRMCEAHGTVDGYDVRLRQAPDPHMGGTPSVTLVVTAPGR